MGSLFNVPTSEPNAVDAPVQAQATDTELAATRKVAPVAGTLPTFVLRWIIEADDNGATGKELGQRYALPTGRNENNGSARYSVMPRCTELSSENYGRLIRDSRLSRGGSILWVA